MRGPGEEPTLGQNLDPQPQGQVPGRDYDPTDLGNKWSEWVGKPNNRAALMQFGIAMLQPMGMGQNVLGHAASAVGSGGEASQRVTQQEQQALKSDTEAELRTARASQAESNATNAEARSRLSGENLELRRAGLEQKGMLGTLQAQTRNRMAHEQYVRDTEKANQNDALMNPKATPRPVLNFQDWLKAGGGEPVGGGPAAPAETATGGGTGAATPGASTIRSTKDFLTQPSTAPAMARIKQLAASSDPNEQAEARRLAERFKPYVIDPDNLYSALGIK